MKKQMSQSSNKRTTNGHPSPAHFPYNGKKEFFQFSHEEHASYPTLTPLFNLLLQIFYLTFFWGDFYAQGEFPEGQICHWQFLQTKRQINKRFGHNRATYFKISMTIINHMCTDHEGVQWSSWKQKILRTARSYTQTKIDNVTIHPLPLLHVKKKKKAKIMRNYNVQINLNKSCILAGKTKKELCSTKSPQKVTNSNTLTLILEV